MLQKDLVFSFVFSLWEETLDFVWTPTEVLPTRYLHPVDRGHENLGGQDYNCCSRNSELESGPGIEIRFVAFTISILDLRRPCNFSFISFGSDTVSPFIIKVHWYAIKGLMIKPFIR